MSDYPDDKELHAVAAALDIIASFGRKYPSPSPYKQRQVDEALDRTWAVLGLYVTAEGVAGE